MRRAQERKATAFTPSLSQAETRHRQRAANKQARVIAARSNSLFLKGLSWSNGTNSDWSVS